jgi:hypothetical protein
MKLEYQEKKIDWLMINAFNRGTSYILQKPVELYADRHDMTEILLKVALSTINKT